MWNGAALSAALRAMQGLDDACKVEHIENMGTNRTFGRFGLQSGPTVLSTGRVSGLMFTIVAATVFFAAFLLAAIVIIGMFALYHEKMVAALLFEPIPQEPPVYRLRISRRRAAPSRPLAPTAIRPHAFAA